MVSSLNEKMHAACYCLVLFHFVFMNTVCLAAVDDGGFGTQFTWRTLDEGLEEARTEDKPLMLIIHKSWCGACKALKPQFSNSPQIESLSRHFVMVNTGDNDEPQDKKYAPDGAYVPRIYFLDSAGEVQQDIYNVEGNSNYKYYYFNTETIIASMKKAVTQLSGKQRTSVDEL